MIKNSTQDNLKKPIMAVTDWVWIVLLSFIVVGWFYPIIGILAVICMLAPVIYGFIKGGRVWCGSFCPRGSFLAKLIEPLSRKGKIPKVLASPAFRYGLLTFLFFNLGWGVIKAWGNFAMIGKVFVQLILVTTLFAITIGIKYQPRTWCTVCPMGTLSTAAIKSKDYLKPVLTKKRLNHKLTEKPTKNEPEENS